MKKFLALLLVLILMCGVAGYFLFQQGYLGKKQTAVEEILPAEPFAYMQMRDLKTVFDGFSATHFWQAMMAIDYRAVMEKTGASSSELARFDQIRQHLSLSTNQKLFMEFFGEEVAVGEEEVHDPIHAPRSAPVSPAP